MPDGRSAGQAGAAVLAVDGGNSKADVALIGPAGELLAAVRGPTVSHQAVGIDTGMDRLSQLVRTAAERAELPTEDGGPVAKLGVFALAGADYPSDVRLLERSLRRRGFATVDLVLNDSFGALRAGTDRDWGVVLICGQGINAAAINPDGRRARFEALGEISGDWGGGTSIGQAGLAAAVRGRDGRGPRTSLERLVPAHFGMTTPAALTRAMYEGRIRMAQLAELPPIVFGAAADGDAAARAIADRLAEELATMATALMRRLRMTSLDPDIVLAGGVFRTRDAEFFEALERRIREVAARARLVRLTAPPVAGAAILGLDRLDHGPVDPASAHHLRAALAEWSASLA